MRTTNVSFGPIWPSTVGFDNIINELDSLLNAQTPTSTFPPHNIIKVDDYQYVVELAIAGFNKQEVTITLKDGLLEIKGQKSADDNEVQYLHKGIGTRSFIKTIRLADTVEVRGAEFKDGILRVALENVIPESKKPRNIEISDSLPLIQPKEKELLVEKQNQQYDMDS
jgi:molecular chaperone IbpA